MRGWLLVVAAMFVAQPALAQPVFGISKGQQVDSLKVVRSYDNDNFSVTAPAPNEEFESYMVTAPKKTGVCRVTGLGVSYVGPNAERDVRAAFARFRGILDGKYGTSEAYSIRGADSDGSYAERIRNKKAVEAAFWPAGGITETSSVSQDIGSIGLSVVALESGDLYLSLRYEFKNYAACTKGDGGSSGL